MKETQPRPLLSFKGNNDQFKTYLEILKREVKRKETKKDDKII